MGFAGLQHGFQIQNISRKKSYLYLIDINLSPVVNESITFILSLAALTPVGGKN